MLKTSDLSIPGTDHIVYDRCNCPSSFLKYQLRQHSKFLFTACFCGLISVTAFQVVPILLGIGIDRGISQHHYFFSSAIALIILVLGIVGAIALMLREKYVVYSKLAIFYSTMNLLVNKAIMLGGTLTKKISTGATVSTGIEDTFRVCHGIAFMATNIISSLYFGLANCMYLWKVGSFYAVVAAITTVFFVVLSFPLLVVIKKREQITREQSATLTGISGDIVQGLRILAGVGGQRIFYKNYVQQSQILRRRSNQLGIIWCSVSSLVTVGPIFPALLMIYCAGKEVVAGTMSSGNFIVVTTYAGLLSWAVWDFVEIFYELIGVSVSAERITNILSIDSEYIPPTIPAQLPPSGSAIYDPIAGITIGPGETIAIVGYDPEHTNRLIANVTYHSPQSPCSLGAVPFTRLALSEVRNRILLALNDDYIFSATIRENITVGRNVSDEFLTRVLVATGCDEICENLPDGLETVVLDDGRNLSGGQRQRIRLARAVMSNSEYLVLVDPTSALDALLERVIIDGIIAIRAPKHDVEMNAAKVDTRVSYDAEDVWRTTIFATGSWYIVSRCSRVIFIDSCENIHIGTHTELLSHHEYFSLLSRNVTGDFLGDISQRYPS